MQIKPGVYYKTRGGRRMEVFQSIRGEFYSFFDDCSGIYFCGPDGKSSENSNYDIISEWQKDTAIKRWINFSGPTDVFMDCFPHDYKSFAVRIDPTAPKGQRIVEVE